MFALDSGIQDPMNIERLFVPSPGMRDSPALAPMNVWLASVMGRQTPERLCRYAPNKLSHAKMVICGEGPKFASLVHVVVDGKDKVACVDTKTSSLC